MGRDRQQRKNAETRNAILDAAIAIGLEEGFDELSIRKITDKLGYSAAIVYHYFKDKQEILDTIQKISSLFLNCSPKFPFMSPTPLSLLFLISIRIGMKALTNGSI